MQEIQTVLTGLGYSLLDFGKEFRARPIYRESNNTTSLAINKQTGRWADYSMGIGGSFEELVKMTLNLGSVKEAKNWLQSNHNFESIKLTIKPRLTMSRVFPLEMLKELLPDHSYWIKRGVSRETLVLFGGGVVTTGKMARRYVFPIRNSKGQIIGFSGRDITDKSFIKWKHLGEKMGWQFPLTFNYEVICEKKEIVLVESIGDMLALWEAGIKNVMVLFGITLGAIRLRTLLATDPRHIIVATNNDEEKNIAGKMVAPGVAAAHKIDKGLRNYFDAEQIIVSLPQQKDFGVMNKEQIHAWYEGCKSQK